jgi:hypothetical protein
MKIRCIKLHKKIRQIINNKGLKEMKPKIVYVFLGKPNREYEMISKNTNDDCEIFYLFDKEYMDELMSIRKETVMFFDLSDENNIQQLIYDLMPIQHIIICPILEKHTSYIAAEKEVADLLREVFILTKMIYVPVMSLRKIKVWYLDLSSLIQWENNSNNILANSFSAGLGTISKILGMELSKKKVIVNLFKAADENYWVKLKAFLLWGHDKQLYLTMQELIV